MCFEKVKSIHVYLFYCGNYHQSRYIGVGAISHQYGNQSGIAMDVQYTETARNDPNCEIRYGGSSWDARENSIKYTWFTVAGTPARGGEFPIEALPQMIEI